VQCKLGAQVEAFGFLLSNKMQQVCVSVVKDL
jgi:hypothetical protein